MSSEAPSQPEAISVGHFRAILQRETESLSRLCETWAKILEQQDNNNQDGEEQLGAVRTTIGQAKLLMSQRFKQFSDLIDNCEFNTGPLPTRLEDLLGFWEMINYQVEDVVRKFKSLDEKCSNQMQ